MVVGFDVRGHSSRSPLGVLASAGLLVVAACGGELGGLEDDPPGLGSASDVGTDAGGEVPVDAGAVPDADPPADAASAPDARSTSDAGDEGACGSAREQQERELTNVARAEEGSRPVACHVLMTEVARAHSRDMCARSYFDHVNPDGDSPFDRMRAAGVSFRAAAENIAAGNSTARATHEQWMNSPGHRTNLLNDRYGRIGVGYAACDGGYRHYWTQIFAD